MDLTRVCRASAISLTSPNLFSSLPSGAPAVLSRFLPWISCPYPLAQFHPPWLFPKMAVTTWLPRPRPFCNLATPLCLLPLTSWHPAPSPSLALPIMHRWACLHQAPCSGRPLPAADPTFPFCVPAPSIGGSAPGNQPTLGSHTTGAGSGGGGNWKDTILASNAAQHQVAPVCRKPRTIARHSPCYSEEESSDSSDFNAGSEDCWAAVKRWATKDGSWELADKIAPYTAPVIYKRGGRNSCWKPISYVQLKELCKAAKDYGLGLPYFKNLLQVTLSTLTLVLHDIKNIISCLLSPAE